MKPLTLEEIISAVKGTLISGDKNIVIESITTDTRKISKGDLFIPIKGENFDGHCFIEKAFESGASCCLSHVETNCNKPLILVEDTRKALRDLAEYYLSKFDIPVIGITGSVGKTTTKDIIASVLSEKYNVLRTEGNFNNGIGLPLTVFKIEEAHEVVVLEMGMSHFGEIHDLAKIGRPDIAVITNIGASHIENLGSREGILKAKSEIFDFMDEKCTAVLNADDDKLITLDGSVKNGIKWYGVKNKRGIYADNIIPRGLEGITCTINTDNGKFDVYISVPGNHMVLNAMAATSVGIELGLTLEEIKKGIENFVPGQMRMTVIKVKNDITLINDVYNANPVSMKAAIDVLNGVKGNKVAIIGDMFELGEFSKEMHYNIGKYVAEKGIDLLIAIGNDAKAICDGALEKGCNNAYHYKTKDDFFEKGIMKIKSSDTVLVKASRGMHFEKIVDKIQEVK